MSEFLELDNSNGKLTDREMSLLCGAQWLSVKTMKLEFLVEDK